MIAATLRRTARLVDALAAWLERPPGGERAAVERQAAFSSTQICARRAESVLRDAAGSPEARLRGPARPQARAEPFSGSQAEKALFSPDGPSPKPQRVKRVTRVRPGLWALALDCGCLVYRWGSEAEMPGAAACERACR